MLLRVKTAIAFLPGVVLPLGSCHHRALDMGALSVTLDPQRTEFLHDSESGHFDYTYRLSVGTDRYEFQAIPEERGRRSFYCDQTGVIRHSFTAELANAASEELR